MKKHAKLLMGFAVLTVITAVASWYLARHPIPVLQPAGTVGHQERNLIIFCALLSLAVVLPVFGMLGHIAWKYREGNKKATYRPNEDGNHLAEAIWWLVPTLMMVVISIITWRSSYALDPYKQLSSTQKTLHIQVVALDWKWLFIYPDKNIAMVNQVAIPINTPVDFEITSDTVMTSFWVPQLGGQMYAMPGMSTHLNLDARRTGNFDGVAANISGKGFSDMKFQVQAMTHRGYEGWIDALQRTQNIRLDAAAYAALASPSTANKPTYYNLTNRGLYDTIMMKYMMPMQTNTAQNAHDTEHSEGGSH